MIESIATKCDVSKAKAADMLNCFIAETEKTLKKGGSVQIVGFGSFSVVKRAARTGRNPATGETIKIKASKLPKFRPGKAFKDAI